MGLAEKLFDGLRSTIEMRGDIDRLSERLRDISAEVLGHERRLIRIETLIELSQARTAAPPLPDPGSD